MFAQFSIKLQKQHFKGWPSILPASTSLLFKIVLNKVLSANRKVKILFSIENICLYILRKAVTYHLINHFRCLCSEYHLHFAVEFGQNLRCIYLLITKGKFAPTICSHFCQSLFGHVCDNRRNQASFAGVLSWVEDEVMRTLRCCHSDDQQVSADISLPTKDCLQIVIFCLPGKFFCGKYQFTHMLYIHSFHAVDWLKIFFCWSAWRILKVHIGTIIETEA